jgi:hypothetical protein
MQFYDSMVVFERGKLLKKRDLRISGRQNLIKGILR